MDVKTAFLCVGWSVLTVVLSAVAPVSPAAAATVNAIRNNDLTMPDGMGGTVGWNYYNTTDSFVSARPKGDGIVEISFYGPTQTYFRQSPCALKSGGRYRLSAEVRTAGLRGSKVRLTVWRAGWSAAKATPPFPDDTKGGWRTVEWSGAIAESPDPENYTVAVSGDGGGGTGQNVVEIRNFRLEPLDEETAKETKGVPDRSLRPLVCRIVPIDPLLAKVPAARAAMTFYWPGEPACGVSACTLSGAVDGGAEKSSKLGANGRAVLDFGRLAVGEHRIVLTLKGPDGSTLGRNDYRFVARENPPEGPSGRRLNNFVTELVRQPLADGKVRFYRPTDGWVWMSFRGADASARGRLDDAADDTVAPQAEHPYVEAQRWVSAGWHTLDVRGATRGEIRIHAVKNLVQPSCPADRESCDFSGFSYAFGTRFWNRFVLPTANTLNAKDETNAAYYAKRGYRIFGGVKFGFNSPLWQQPEEQWKVLTGGLWSKGFDVSVDESAIGALRLQHVLFSESVWKALALKPSQRINLYWGDATKNAFGDPKVHASLLAALANSGEGTGVSFPETYTPVLKTREEVEPWLELYERSTRAIADIAPAARALTVFNVSPWVDPGHWCDAPCPEADAKALWSHVLHCFATRPGFAENAGLGAGAFGACEEELRRWIVRLFRYYGLEGGTEDLAAVRGFRWTPGFVRNCDFADGLDGWTAKPAKDGGVSARSIVGYGVKVQLRKKVPNGTGDAVAEFTAAKRPNRLEQRLTGLEPGKLYALMFCTANRENVENPVRKRPPLAFRARLEGAEEIVPLRFRHETFQRKKGGGNRRIYLSIHRYVFRATSSEATLVFEDRSDTGKHPPVGTKQVLNYVVFRPYYTERPGEENEISELFKR